jgi:uncharacterized protein
MAITFDPAKRDRTLAERGLDFADAEVVIENRKLQWVDDRYDYGEERIAAIGLLNDRMVVVVWTERGGDRHIISMRHAHDKERRRFKIRMD